MSTQIQWRRGTTAQHSVFTGAFGEVTVDTDKDTLVVHDNSTVGGFPLARESALNTHTARTDNPHATTKLQVGLGNADNTADSVKVVASAGKLTTGRTISLSGDVTGSVSFDGSTNVDVVVNVGNDTHTHAFVNITGKPSTLAGYGITDAVVKKVTSTDNAIVRFDGTTGEVQNSGVIIDDSGNIGSGSQSFNGFGGSGFKNYIINGNFDVWQRETSQTIGGYGSDDKWFNVSVGSTKTHSQVACTDTERALFSASKFSRTVVSSVVGASNEVGKRQSIEDITKLAGKIVTISFWARADGNKKLGYRIFHNFGTGGSPTDVYSIETNILDITSTWQKKTITVAIPSIVGKTIGTDGIHTTSTSIKFLFDAGTSVASYQCPSMIQQSGTFDIAQIQLEEGSVATPFENLSYAQQYEQCRRYYRRYATQQNVNDLAYKMRTTPTESGTAPYTYSADM